MKIITYNNLHFTFVSLSS